MLDFEYVTDKDGKPKAVVVPIEIWRQLFSNDDNVTKGKLLEEIEDYCLSNAMEKAKESPLVTPDEALQYLED